MKSARKLEFLKHLLYLNLKQVIYIPNIHFIIHKLNICSICAIMVLHEIFVMAKKRMRKYGTRLCENFSTKFG